MRNLFGLLVCAVWLFGTPLTAQEQSPEEIIQSTAGEVLNILNDQKAYYRDHPEELEHLVNHRLMDLFDLDYAARLVLGRHGRSASAEQINAFGIAMRDLLVRRYSQGLLDFESEDQLQILPLSGKNSDRLTRVRTRVKLGSGGFAPVDYAFRKTDQGWRAFDVSVEGISYITTYRNQIGPQVQQDGIDAVIDGLRSGSVGVDGN